MQQGHVFGSVCDCVPMHVCVVIFELYKEQWPCYKHETFQLAWR